MRLRSQYRAAQSAYLPRKPSTDMITWLTYRKLGKNRTIRADPTISTRFKAPAPRGIAPQPKSCMQLGERRQRPDQALFRACHAFLALGERPRGYAKCGGQHRQESSVGGAAVGGERTSLLPFAGTNIGALRNLKGHSGRRIRTRARTNISKGGAVTRLLLARWPA